MLDCYCFGYPDERTGEEVCVWIKLKPTAVNVTKESITKFCENKIAYFKVPKHIKFEFFADVFFVILSLKNTKLSLLFRFVDSFPINPNGKVQKFRMVEQMKKDLENETNSNNSNKKSSSS